LTLLSTRLRTALMLPGAALFLLFFVLPLLVMLRYSFASSSNLRLQLVWTLDNYTAFLEGPIYLGLLGRSLLIAALVSGITVVIGYPTAWIIAHTPPRWRNVLLVALIVPWWASYIARVFAWYTLFGSNGVINKTLVMLGVTDAPLAFFTFNVPALVITEVNLFLPLMVLPIYMTLERLNWDLVLAARSLGGSWFFVFRRVVLPLSLPGVVAGVIFVFMPVAGTFVVPELIGGTSGLMFGKVIAVQFGAASNWALGAALAVALLVVLLLCLAVLVALRNRFAGEHF
jgi:spermidine/putrescine transport system permease protein